MNHVAMNPKTNELVITNRRWQVIGSVPGETYDPPLPGRHYELVMTRAVPELRDEGAVLVPEFKAMKAEVAEIYRFWFRRYLETALDCYVHQHGACSHVATLQFASRRTDSIAKLLLPQTLARILVDEVASVWRRAVPGEHLDLKKLARMRGDRPHPETAAREAGLLDPRRWFKEFSPRRLKAVAAEVEWQLSGVSHPRREATFRSLVRCLSRSEEVAPGGAGHQQEPVAGCSGGR